MQTLQIHKEVVNVSEKRDNRVVVGVMMGVIILAFVGINIFSSIPLLPIFVSFLAVLVVAELASMWKLNNDIALKISIIIQFVIMLCACIAIWIIERTFDDWALIFLATTLAVVCQNVSSYYVGKYLLPRASGLSERFLKFHPFKYSPGKRLGVAIFCSGISMVIAVWFWLAGHRLPALSAAVGTCFAMPGDWLESRLKRLAGIKDSGELLRDGNSMLAKAEMMIASHGGFLDRFDSLSLCFALMLPIIWRWLKW